MKKLQGAQALNLLRRLLLEWNDATQEPAVARAVFLSHNSFADSLVADFVRQLLLCQGNWRVAIKAMQCSERVAKLKVWVESVTRRPVKGLLEWKGGAS